ncbi:hypothetical protein N1851_005873 [Merluccius polli]|uniref:Integrase catalytic domain-containing protein n=1 Tax=Merluccius polli TaxID=89951 RepID=A0AA47N6H5_MERPO|nr:hypothetical protein N1851_005873 [Merluccius polli]
MEMQDAAPDNTGTDMRTASQPSSVTSGLEPQTQKRVIKLTAKALAEKLDRLQTIRKARLNKATTIRKTIQGYMSNGEKTQVQNALGELIGVCEDVKCIHESLLFLLPSDEAEKHETWFKAKMMFNDECVNDVKKWISGNEGCVKANENVEDDIKPDDSVSNIGSKCSAKTGGSGGSSTASSARVKAEAERAALVARAAALKEQHALEEQEQQLRRRREQLQVEAELAASAAKLAVLQASSGKGSRAASNGMNSYLERERRKPESSFVLNPMANEYRSESWKSTQQPHDSTKWMLPSDKPPSVIVQQKESEQRFQTVSNLEYISKELEPGNTIKGTSQYLPRHTAKMHSKEEEAHSTNQQLRSQSLPPDLLTIMHRQNEITAALVQQQRSLTLPSREIPIFDGDPLQYGAFIKAFEQGVEEKAGQADCLYYLEQFTRGLPRELVRSCQHMDHERGYALAKALIQDHFGNPYKIAAAYMERALAWQAMKTEQLKELRAFSLFLRGCCNALEELQYLEELDMPVNMRAIVTKLPYKMREQWRTTAHDIMENAHRRAQFVDLVKFIERRVRIISDPLFGDIQDPLPARAGIKSSTRFNAPTVFKSQPRDRVRGNVIATTVTSMDVSKADDQTADPGKEENGCLCCARGHSLEDCKQFKGKRHKDKIQFLREKGICFACLCVGHMSRDCGKRSTCKVCGQSHPTVLHIKRQTPQEEPSKDVPMPLKTCGHTGAGMDRCVLSILPVQVKHAKGNHIIKTYAFLDPGSSGTFCSENLMRRLNVTGRRTNFLLRTMTQKTVRPAFSLTGLEVAGLDSFDFHNLPEVITQKEMPVTEDDMTIPGDLAKWPQLSKVHIPSIKADVDLLIGINAPKLLEPWEVIHCEGDGPYAVRTVLGWVVNGPLNGTSGTMEEDLFSATVNRISVSRLEEMLSNQYNHDFSETTKEEKEMSREDHRFMHIMEQSAVLQEGKYCLKLPFRKTEVCLPNNFAVARQRIQGLKKRFLNDKGIQQEYTRYMSKLIRDGYAEKVPQKQLHCKEGKVWYIPHHGVHHPRKGSLRVVFDCGATFQGSSLNSELLQGPNLTSSLLGVLSRFRQEPVAFMGDIKAMFHQVKVAEEDRDYLRFLWWPDGDVTKDLAEYRMTVHLFGAVSSPSCASYALKKTADDHHSEFPVEVLKAIKQNFYVDDCLKSSATEGEAVQTVQDLVALCRKGGFILEKWISNSRTVLQTITEDQRAQGLKELDLDRDKLPMERALGLQWCVETDSFRFRLEVKQQPFTRRGMLSVNSSVYDPFGFLAPVTLPAKMMQQELCRRSYGWDDSLPQDILHQWKSWLEDLDLLVTFNVNRCIKPVDFGELCHAQLHHFADASEGGYGTVTYLRMEWPKTVLEKALDINDQEVRKQVTTNAITATDVSTPIDRLITYFSDWRRLKTAVAWYLRLKTMLMERSDCRRQLNASVVNQGTSQGNKQCVAPRSCVLTLDDLLEAEVSIIRYCQAQKYNEEISALSSGRTTVSRQSSLYRLDPIFHDGLLRVGGRLSRGAMPEETKHPLILSKDQHIAMLILKHVHQNLGHGGRAHTLSSVRKKFWITNGNSAIRKVIAECGFCRRYNGRAVEQKMADLPKARILPDLPPFTNTGVDYFGPIEVKKGRSTCKRYGAIFTCMASRAIHLEVASSLDTDACINALRRFVSRRGQVTHLWSDNGTNFVGAERELRDALAALNQDRIQGVLSQVGIRWNFNPPTGSHHGGVWERMIRLIRRVLSSVLRQQTLDDDGFHTMLCEVEAILNDRPITKLSDDPNDLEPLTPNHLLLLKGKPALPPGVFEPHDQYVKRRWRQIQYLADLFWKRWVREYLPLLQERQKWNQKKRSLVVGDIVTIMDASAPRGSWPLGKVLEVFPDKYGLVRSVKLQTKSNIIERPVTKLTLLHGV